MEKNDSAQNATAAANHWFLAAQLAEMTALRFSPAGIPVIDCILRHASDVVEAGALRKVQVQLKAMAVGPVAEQLSRQALGTQARFAGFMSSPARSRQGQMKSPAVVFHIQSFVTGNTHC